MFKWTADKGWGVVITLAAIAWPTAIILKACLATHTARQGRAVGLKLTHCRRGCCPQRAFKRAHVRQIHMGGCAPHQITAHGGRWEKTGNDVGRAAQGLSWRGKYARNSERRDGRVRPSAPGPFGSCPFYSLGAGPITLYFLSAVRSSVGSTSTTTRERPTTSPSESKL